MSLIPLIVDAQVNYGIGSSRASSLLTLPLGTGTILSQLLTSLRKVSPPEVFIMNSLLKEQPEFLQGAHPPQVGLRVVSEEALSSELERFDTSDFLLVIDPRLWPVGGYDFSSCSSLTDFYRGATHVIAIGSGGEIARERVECDAEGWVRRVQRLYASKNYSDMCGAAITHSLVPLRAVIGSRFA